MSEYFEKVLEKDTLKVGGLGLEGGRSSSGIAILDVLVSFRNAIEYRSALRSDEQLLAAIMNDLQRGQCVSQEVSQSFLTLQVYVLDAAVCVAR